MIKINRNVNSKINLTHTIANKILIFHPNPKKRAELNSKKSSRLIFLITLTLIFELIGLPQPLTGPLVNMMLILTALVISPIAGCVLGLITPVVAGLRGQLPALLLPMIPFIVAANALLVVGFSVFRHLLARWLKDNNILLSIPAWCGLVVGATVKFLILYNAARFFLPFFMGKNLPQAIIAAMSIPQLVTALIGGALAFVVYRMLQTRSLI